MNCCDDYGCCTQGLNCPARPEPEAEEDTAARRDRIAEEHRASSDSVDMPRDER